MVVPGVLFTALAAYPFIEAWATGDKREHHVLDRPRNVPFRTAAGVSILTGFVVLILAGSNDIIATVFHLSINDITYVFRVLLFVAPAFAFWVTKRICLSLQRKDRELVLHGHETGTVLRFAHGGYVEVHRELDEHERWLRVNYDAHRPLEIEPAEDSRGVVRKGYRKDRRRQRVSRWFYEDRIEPVTPAELAAAHSHGEHDAITEGTPPPTGLVGAAPVGGGTALADPPAETASDERNH
jgi:ubiquinol-cytochrome c reductase cytochrome b subunit